MKYLLVLATLLATIGLGFLLYYDQKTQADYVDTFTVWTTFPDQGNWLDGRVSLTGGELTKPREAYDYAESIGFGAVENLQELEYQLARNTFVPLTNNRFVEVDDGVSSPFVPPLVRLFVERLGRQYQEAGCGKLVVTSALRLPETQDELQNGSRWSVHPAGLAVDFRIPPDTHCRTWLDETLELIESHGRIDATHEQSPPHFHVVVVMGTYGQFVQTTMSPMEKAGFVETVLEE